MRLDAVLEAARNVRPLALGELAHVHDKGVGVLAKHLQHVEECRSDKVLRHNGAARVGAANVCVCVCVCMCVCDCGRGEKECGLSFLRGGASSAVGLQSCLEGLGAKLRDDVLPRGACAGVCVC